MSNTTTFGDVVRKTIMPMVFLMFWGWMVVMLLKLNGCSDTFWILFWLGLPFGIHKMCFILIPHNMDIGGSLGVMAFGVIIGGLFGILFIPVYIIRAIYVLIRYLVKK